jgi:hypothetical protein
VVIANSSEPWFSRGVKECGGDHHDRRHDLEGMLVADAGDEHAAESTPVSVETPTIRPTVGGLAPRSRAKSGSSGARQMA